ncbi:hypothetical protein ACFLX0_02225 [Chloroflexota bacterium]
MNFDAIAENLPFFAAIIGFILLQFFMRRKHKRGGTQQEIAQNLLAEVRLDLALTEVFRFHWRVKKFETVSWHLNRNKLDFLPQSLRVSITDTFTMAEDFNQQISAARKNKSTSHMASVDVARLKVPLLKSKEGLEQWLMSQTGTKAPPPKYPSVLDDFGR